MAASRRPLLNPIVPHGPFLLGKEDHKYDEEHHQYEEYLNHEPAVGGDRLKVFEDLAVGHVHIQRRVLHVGINPTDQQREIRIQRCSIQISNMKIQFNHT